MSDAVQARLVGLARWIIPAAIGIALAVSIAMRLAFIGSEGVYTFDEGVYWQTLRAMHDGHLLYRDIFFSQPPLFALISRAVYELGGQTIGAARLAVAGASVIGIVAIGLLVARLANRAAGVAAVALLVTSPFFLKQSQILQADAMSISLALGALAAAACWLLGLPRRSGFAWAALTGVLLAASLLVKLLSVAAVIPIAWFWLSNIRRKGLVSSTILFVAAGLATALIVLVPFAGVLPEMTRQVVTFHLDAGLVDFDRSGTVYPWAELGVLSVGAILGFLTAYRARDRHAIPLALWALGTAAFLFWLSPLWPQHVVAIIPPLVALAALAARTQPGAAAVALIAIVGLSVQAWTLSSNAARAELSIEQQAIVADLADAPEGYLVTDNLFLAAVAGRSVPPWLADVSTVRIRSGFLTPDELTEATRDSSAVLFFAGRLELPELREFETWLPSAGFRLEVEYGPGRRLWLR